MISPMLASAAEVVQGAGDRVVEPKLDGWRAIWDGERLYTRSSKQITAVPYIEEALANLPPGTILDGEIVDLHAEPGKEWNRTQSILSSNKPHILGRRPHTAEDVEPLTYVVFDVLAVEGRDVKNKALSERRELLPLLVRLADNAEIVQTVEQYEGEDIEALFDSLTGQGYEGVVAKRLDSPYVEGARNGSWLKIKPVLEMDVEVTGTYEPEPGSKYDGNSVGGITFRTPGGYDGKCAGMDDSLREQLWLAPENFTGLVAVVAYASEAPDTKALRFPRFLRFRDPDDKAVSELASAPTIPDDNSDEAKMMLLERVFDLEKENSGLKSQLEALELAREIQAEAEPKPRPAKAGAKRSSGAIGGNKRKRNYKAMKPPKLLGAIEELEGQYGESFSKALTDERAGEYTVAEHLIEAKKVAKEKGLV